MAWDGTVWVGVRTFREVEEGTLAKLECGHAAAVNCSVSELTHGAIAPANVRMRYNTFEVICESCSELLRERYTPKQFA